MKKIVAIYLIILVGLFTLLSALDQKSDYIVEKKFWKIYHQQLDIAKDPNVIPDKNFERVINDYRNIIEKYPNSRLTPGLYIRVGEMYALKQDYEAAREIFYKIIELYPDNKELSAEALFKVGKIYEIANNWPEASKVYTDIIQNYPLTEAGLSTPIYIANYFKNQNKFQGTMDAYESAIRHYTNIASQYDRSKAGLSAMRHLSNCYLDQNRWTEAINTLGSVLKKYSTSEFLTVKDVDLMIKTINITAAYKLKDYDVAIRLYQEIIAQNPGHPLISYLHKVIDAFNQLKAKGIQVSDQK